jgi:peptidoglycan/xylan/chitin deacetylase (PgdA/CDA1 family)
VTRPRPLAHGPASRTWIVNLTVHGVGTPGRPMEDEHEHAMWVSVDQLERVLDAAVGRPEVTVTFDDGNASDVELALPRLLERGLVARFFVLAGLVGQPGRLDEDGVRELCRAGMVVGSHGWAHRDWRRLPSGPNAARLAEEELVRARQRLGELTGTDVCEVAVPFGSYDRRVLQALRRTGATRVYTSDGGWARPDSWLQARTSVRADDGPDWARRLVSERPGVLRRLRGRAVTATKRLRG